MKKEEILKKVDILYDMWKKGLLGGEVMPEDENPALDKDSLENYLYFTLPMALNYQRNSYTLWESANKTYHDEDTRFIFNPKEVLKRDIYLLLLLLLAHLLHIPLWQQLYLLLLFVKIFPFLLLLESYHIQFFHMLDMIQVLDYF